MDKQNQATNDNGSTTNNNLSANTKGSTMAEVNTYHTLKGKSRNHILFATAMVEVKNKSGKYVPCRALLDSGSIRLHNREVCTMFEVTKNPDTHQYKA
jgi:hypothetical protein